MKNITIASVIAENGLSRCISATASSSRGRPDLQVTGVTDRAAREIRALFIAAIQSRGIKLPKRIITIELIFDAPFEATCELCLAAYISIAETICLS